jgi:hypothetical protein
LEFDILRVPHKMRLSKVKHWDFVKKNYRRTNLMAFLVALLGSRNKTKCSKFGNLTSQGHPPYKFRLRKVKTWAFVKQILPWNKSDGNYNRIQEQNEMLEIWKFYILGIFPYKFRLKNDDSWVLRKFHCRINFKHFLLLICGKFTLANM